MTKTNKSNSVKLSDHFQVERLGLAAGAAALFVSTAYMNVSSWIAQADTTAQGVANGLLAGGFELMALCGLAWAGFQYAKGRKGAAGVAAAIAISAIVFNTFAAQHYLHLQMDEIVNGIEASGYDVSLADSRVDALEAEIDSIVRENGGTIPRPIEAIEAQYGYLDPESNPINMGRRDSEIALREEYNRLQAEIVALREGASDAAVASNDTARTVIPSTLIGPFIWALEAIKGTIFFALGTTDPRAKAVADKRKWAAIHARKRAQRRVRRGRVTVGAPQRSL